MARAETIGPCLRECPRRSGTCKIDCEEYLQHIAGRNERYARKAAEARVRADTNELQWYSNLRRKK